MSNDLLPKLYVVGGSIGYASYLRSKPGRSVQFELTQNPAHADIALFTGGEDVDPATYGEQCSKTTHYTNRDKHEIEMFNFFVEEEVPMIGICRGLQLFAGLNGGRLIQDTTGHAGSNHGVIFEGYDDTCMGDEFKGSITLPYTSAHHQMVDPTRIKADWKILGRSETRRSRHYLGGDDKEIHGVDTEIECVFFPKTQCLGIQGHPEWMDPTSPSVEFWRQLIKTYLL
jgi:gamma-glutamyl-gamma-aminobutyrate hydrolase PuuD